MPDTGLTGDDQYELDPGRRYLIRFEQDTLRSRPLWIRVIIEFVGTYLLVTVAAGSGVINRYAGGGPISRTAAVIAPGALVMVLIYAWGPLSGLHINRRSPSPSPAAACSPPGECCLLGGPVRRGHPGYRVPSGRLGNVSAGGNYPIAKQGGDWRAFLMEIVLTTSLVSVILNSATGTGGLATTRRSRSAPQWHCSGCSPARAAARP